MRLAAIVLTGLLFASLPTAAQTPPTQRAASVRIVVHDLTTLPILNAEVTLTSSDGNTIKATTDNRGEARFEDVRPGVYSGRVTSNGFNTLDLGEISIRPGGGSRVRSHSKSQGSSRKSTWRQPQTIAS